VRIAVGGAAAALIDTAIAEAGATRVESLGAWHDLLTDVRR
jgi:hypothetical protein